MLMLAISEHLLEHNTESRTEKVRPNREIETKGGVITGDIFYGTVSPAIQTTFCRTRETDSKGSFAISRIFKPNKESERR